MWLIRKFDLRLLVMGASLDSPLQVLGDGQREIMVCNAGWTYRQKSMSWDEWVVYFCENAIKV